MRGRSEVMGEPEDDEEKDHDGDGDENEDDAEKAEQEGVVLPGVAPGLAQVPHHKLNVAAVGFPRDVEEGAEERDGADEDLEGEVDHHAEEGDGGDAANPCREDDEEGSETGDYSAEAGDQCDEAVESDADGSEGDAEPVVEEMGEELDVLVRKEAFGTLAERRCGGE